MGELEFNKMYHTAIKKIAVGFYILDTCGDQLGYDTQLVLTNKHQLCSVLANGISVSEANIYNDACSIDLPADYIVQLDNSGLLEDLIYSMRISLEN